MIEKSETKKSEIMEILCTKIKPIPYNGVNDLKMKLRSSLRKVYLNKKTFKDLETQ